jgi:hypothetical protein
MYGHCAAGGVPRRAPKVPRVTFRDNGNDPMQSEEQLERDQQKETVHHPPRLQEPGNSLQKPRLLEDDGVGVRTRARQPATWGIERQAAGLRGQKLKAFALVVRGSRRGAVHCSELPPGSWASTPVSSLGLCCVGDKPRALVTRAVNRRPLTAADNRLLRKL